ncbi:winged helix-turn-helix transcriptional regulator [Ramlibacter sp. USB13]|uniref:Winged helix-turn-helix transcriptional regulator n=1 Tax=Ramlibacter cellulosilyticus TaxID=2764187 RepID=A0A923MS45_9BURK|nr:winged helix-turn-helix domain-containing protein [Ramlibacter cellulosilyticus]MBC5783184.1 winged helix-turn-helix transcriptional regulator [Ramlibacter cellulosilyticus]
MEAEPDLARIAATVGDPRRIQMLALLMEGRALTAKELALGAGVEPATASTHLKRLLEDGLLEAAAQGRHKYFRFASEQVAQLVESLMRVAPRRVAAVRPSTPQPLRRARYCYDHLAGALGTGLLAHMLRKGWLQDDAEPKQLALTPRGTKALGQLGVDVEAAQARRRQFACRCLDWSERRDHLGGALGAALADELQARHWIERRKHSREVRITPAGEEALSSLGVKLA